MNTSQLARIAGLIGEPARTAMLVALMDGRAHTAHELAVAGQVTPATASKHLAQLVDAGLLAVVRQGRHRYHRLASQEVARVLEDLLRLAAAPSPRARRVVAGPADARLRLARTCYDHLAGGIGVAIAERLVQDGAVVIEEETAVVTDRAAAALEGLGLKFALLEGQPAGKRPACRPCLDWTERRPHLAGRLGALLCAHCLAMGWLLQRPDGRALDVAPRGAQVLRDWLGLARWQALVTPDEASAGWHDLQPGGPSPEAASPYAGGLRFLPETRPCSSNRESPMPAVPPARR